MYSAAAFICGEAELHQRSYATSQTHPQLGSYSRRKMPHIVILTGIVRTESTRLPPPTETFNVRCQESYCFLSAPASAHAAPSSVRYTGDSCRPLAPRGPALSTCTARLGSCTFPLSMATSLYAAALVSNRTIHSQYAQICRRWPCWSGVLASDPKPRFERIGSDRIKLMHVDWKGHTSLPIS